MRSRRRGAMTLGLIIGVLAIAAAAAWWLRAPLIDVLPAPPVVVTAADYGRVVNVRLGQRLEVRLPSNHSSGSTWRNNIPLDFLPQEGGISFTESASPSPTGDGYQTTTFRATGKGTGPLFLGYLPNDKQNSLTPSKAFTVVVVVR